MVDFIASEDDVKGGDAVSLQRIISDSVYPAGEFRIETATAHFSAVKKEEKVLDLGLR